MRSQSLLPSRFHDRVIICFPCLLAYSTQFQPPPKWHQLQEMLRDIAGSNACLLALCAQTSAWSSDKAGYGMCLVIVCASKSASLSRAWFLAPVILPLGRSRWGSEFQGQPGLCKTENGKKRLSSKQTASIITVLMHSIRKEQQVSHCHLISDPAFFIFIQSDINL